MRRDGPDRDLPGPGNMPMPPDRYADLVRERAQQAGAPALHPVPSREPVTATSPLAAALLGEARDRRLESGELLLVAEEAMLADLEAAAEQIPAAGELPPPDQGEALLADLAAPRLLAPRLYEIAGWQPPLGEHLKLLRGALNSGWRVGQTMLVGHVETLPERVEHLMRLRDLRDETARVGGAVVVAVKLAGDEDLPGDATQSRPVAESARPEDPDHDRRHALALARLALGPDAVVERERA